ncbi:aldehyde dehydrogenase family protein [Salinibacter ruber]|uniref:Acyl-CoA reductase-like NAD-dependent aldehyde dehydrogenase n=1 Tax=Salinibacter ruber TaxID=146919 RepID=A0A9X2UAZ4_9BACT|nr:aldehyde dehydrogenase family protein [Salinibacter ruber]MCS3657099.1 acyl-CoA reductase-like NAD-dependent aldehyde dehydrogenase [Salinibacter ruber]MCS3952990.1 acyl-CoA reductase-like NAD-dependent aldehyde dehydrogenase [Salinibacter ruber]MCS4119264.1 acyl-CoA reductase-like NAD-dependent aldehyde dehydrogenase [Salinibacter ruber]MCS4155699.1 acyl-CoA reductase-like NAD-dependent aldehyde dehydrogenase [Salinibacter ruber]MCS4171181.1 acyl-CoA reductase-like NAD-dependent aldehyde d
MAATDAHERLPVYKTRKLYIGGGFPRTESGRYITATDPTGEFVANICRASRKDFRDAVVEAREAQDGWSSRSAFNRGQILYRMGEMLESRRQAFVDTLVDTAGYAPDAAGAEVGAAIDRLVYYAGWTDKFSQVFGSINPVASSHFDFSVPEPSGVVAAFCPEAAPLLGLVSCLAPIIVPGNTVILVVENDAPTLALDLAEVLDTSDLPGGVVNILTGHREELREHVGGHRDVDAILSVGASTEERTILEREGAESVTRMEFRPGRSPAEWRADESQSPYWITPFVEFKTTWHPVGR